MSKRIGLLLVAVLVLPVLMTACSTESRDNAEDYVKALLKGDAEKAQEMACESNQEVTDKLLAWYGAQGVDEDSISLKFDVGKGNNQKEIIVTGAYKFGEDGNSFELSGNARERDLNLKFMPAGTGLVEPEEKMDEKDEDAVRRVNTRLVLEMAEEGGDWCVKSVDMGDLLIDAAEGETESEGAEGEMESEGDEGEMESEGAEGEEGDADAEESSD